MAPVATAKGLLAALKAMVDKKDLEREREREGNNQNDKGKKQRYLSPISAANTTVKVCIIREIELLRRSSFV